MHARPASAPPHFPRGSHSGHMTGSIGLLRAWRPERPNRGPAVRDRLHRDTDASAATTVFSRHRRSHDRTGSIWLCAWTLRSGCRPCLQLGKGTARFPFYEGYVSAPSPPNEVGHRRGASIALFRCPLPKRHGQVSLHVAFQRKHPVIIGNKRGLMHCAATQPMTIRDYSSCHPLPCGRSSRPPWWDVIPTTHYDGSVTLPLARFR